MTRRAAAAAVLALLCAASAPVRAEPAPDELSAAMAEFTRAIDEARRSVEQHPYYGDAAERAAGSAYLFSMLLRRIEVQLQQDPDFPLFASVDHRVREGGDNPDQHYQSAPLRGGASYRIWGRRGTVRRLDLQVYAGQPYMPGGGRVVSVLGSEGLHTAADGSFKVTISLERQPGDWLATAPDATAVLVRQTFSDWANETPAEIHIDRIGYEGAARPRITPEQQAERLRKAAAALKATVANWPEFVRRAYVERAPANTLTAPTGTTAQGGLAGRWYSSGWWQLEDDEALILTAWPMPGDYQGIQLTDLWFSSLEYGNRQTSLNADQSWRSADGAFHIVVSARDPGIQNWLDTTGLRRGVILMRFDGLGERPFPKERYPTLRKVKIADLAAELPAATPRFTAEQRAQALRERRRALQRRYGD